MSKLLGTSDRGQLFVMSAPAGTGKTTLIGMLVEEFDSIVQSISFTTRAPREDEIDGVHYHFTSHEHFKEKISRGDFLEYANVFGQYYGTSAPWVEEKLRNGKHVVLVIDTQGALQLMGKIPLTSIFIAPPDFEELSRRLVSRKTDSVEDVAKRLAFAKEEMEKIRYYDYLVVNDELNVAYEVLKSIFIAEGHKVKK